MKTINIKEAIFILKKGGIVIFPTDTAFGVGCRMDRIDSVERLFQIRKRPFNQAVPVLVSDLAMAQRYLASLSNLVRRLIKTYWPGALTIVYYCQVKKVPLLVRGGGKNLGVRMPNHPVILKMIREIGVPILGSSANFHGKATPYSLVDLDLDFVKLTDGVVKGDCYQGNVSTVIDCSRQPFTIIREGAVKVSQDFLL